MSEDVENKDTDQVEGDIVQLVSFLLDEMEYGIDILKVHEIIRMPEITRLPNTPDFIKGVINLRGSVIPVVDVRERFGFSRVEVTDLTRIIVIEIGEKLVGLLVDNVYQVVRLPLSHIEQPSELIEGISEEFIEGIGRLRNRLIIILKLDSMLFSKAEREEEAIA
ncbi:MAG: purine-binding chemotaxis protein CheW [Spirochaetes bacterium]|nr:MAG: purine-binding chemotaxis protein CheW [Spirochaetota bacterium]